MDDASGESTEKGEVTGIQTGESATLEKTAS